MPYLTRPSPHVRRRGLVLTTVVLGLVLGASAPISPPELPPAIYRDPSYSPAERAADLVSRMTLAEKASQMVSSQAPAIPRLGIREYGWWNEAIHGVAREGRVNGQNPPELMNTTSYPVSLSLGSTWNPDLVYEVASAISDEAREVVRDNTLDLNFYSPTVNLARDPRWGRNDETYSEDPFLTAAIGAQYVNGMEGKDPSGRLLAEGGGFLKTTTTLKHYAANNSEFNRLDGSSDMDERTLREYYTAQFRAIVRASQPASIMTAYNAVNGVPASAHVHLLETLGRQTFGFTGFYTSDCDSIFQMQQGHRWRPPGSAEPVDEITRHAYANAAGVDLNCQLGYHDRFNYANCLPTAVKDRVVTELGVFTEANLDASLVRLFTARILLGEFDDPATVPWVVRARARVPAGTWENTDANGAVTQTPERLALARRAAAESIVLLRNDPVASPGRDAAPLLPLRVPESGPYRVAVVGPAARPDTMYLGGYSSRQGPSGVGNQVNGYDGLVAALRDLNPQATVDHIPGPDGLDAVAAYDLVLVYLATDDRVAREDADRTDLTLPDGQAELAAEVAARNPATVVYLETIGQVDLGSWAERVPALLWSSYNGQRKGEALADVLVGRVNPSGRLPFTWYRDPGQLPPLDDYAIRPSATSAGRTYMYFTGDVAYPFGHGLSYTAFAHSAPTVDRSAVTADDTVTVSVDVTNTGPVAGAEVVQLYAATPAAAPELARPTRRLVGFRKVVVQPGQTVTVTMPVRVADLAFFDEASDRFVVDPGLYRLEVAASSGDIRGTADIAVTGELTPVPVVLTARPVAAGDEASGLTQRVVYPPGVEITPRLTVAMNDDTRYGFRAPDPLPAGLSVSYRTNRPSVVAVDDDGTIRTVAAGVATVTATVTDGAASVETTFTVVVR